MTEQHVYEEPKDNSFAQFGLPALLFTNLVKMGFNRPTPVQEQAIPFALEGRDVLGSAQTGTGKTAAFAIPVIARLLEDPTAGALVMTPTRELASQILAVAATMLGKGSGVRTALLIGGESMGRQFDQLRASPRLIIGTPGRINDHLRRDGSMLEDVKMVVLDEADRMLDMGFSGQIDEVLEHVSKPCQMLMFSATFPPAIVRFSKTYLNNPQRIAIAPESKTATNIKQDTIHTNTMDKYETLVKELDARTGSIIVFVRTKHGADRLATRLSRENHSADAIHGDLRQNKRDRAIAGFRSGRTRIMVATDVAARGIDVPQIEHVINYDLPQVAEDYVHRIGRTARAGAQGQALSILGPEDGEKWNAILRLVDPGAAMLPQTGGKGRNGRGGNKGRSTGHRKGQGSYRSEGGSSFGGDKPNYKREGGFNDRKAGEGFSAKKRTPRSEKFRGDRDEGTKRPHFDRDERPARQDGERSEGRRFERKDGDRPQGQRFERKEGGYSEGRRFERKEGGQSEGRRFERNDGGRPQGERFERKDGDRPQGRRDGAPRPYAGKKEGERGDRPHNGNARFSNDRNGGDDRGRRFDRSDRSDNRSDRDFRGGDFRQEKPAGGYQGKRREDGDKPRGKSFGGKPGGKPFGGKSDGGKFEGGKKFGGKPGGFKKEGGFNKEGGSRRGAGRHQQNNRSGGGRSEAR